MFLCVLEAQLQRCITVTVVTFYWRATHVNYRLACGQRAACMFPHVVTEMFRGGKCSIAVMTERRCEKCSTSWDAEYGEPELSH